MLSIDLGGEAVTAPAAALEGMRTPTLRTDRRGV